MTEIQDPRKIWQDSLDQAAAPSEEHPPVIVRAEAWPYPDLTRVWVRLQTSAFAAYPNLELTLTDDQGEVISSLFMVEMREPYQSVTLHLRREPVAGGQYRLTLELTRDEQLLDTRVLEFALVFRDPHGEQGTLR